MSALDERLHANFLDGTLAVAVEAMAVSGAPDPIEEAVLREAASKLRLSAELYETLAEFARLARLPTSVTRSTKVEAPAHVYHRAIAVLAQARGEQ